MLLEQRQIDCDTWEEFEKILQELHRHRNAVIGRTEVGVSEFYFRGQGSASWPLETTLDRARKAPWRVSDYYDLIKASQPEIETSTGLRWKIESWPNIEGTRGIDGLRSTTLQVIEYLAFLRHHGFPSPLLDWTISPYVAAFFAFQSPLSERVAIYVYWEFKGSGKTTSTSKPFIESIGHTIRSHKRHFLQQSVYTFCAELRNGFWFYAPHENVLRDAADNLDKSQDQLWKLTIPRIERPKALSVLDAYNLNMFSLFHTDEALLSTIASREIHHFGGRYSDNDQV